MVRPSTNLALLAALLQGSQILAAPSAGCSSSGLASGVHTLDVNGQQRQFTLTVPDNYDPATPYRLVLGIHWWGGSMQDVATGQTVETGAWSYYGLERLAEGSAIFAAPQGIDGGWYNEGGSDFAFLDQMVGMIEDALCVDTDLRFSIGFSWGGSTSVALACRDSEYPLRAIAAIAAAGPYECEPGTRQVGYLGMHGIADNPDNGRTMRDRILANNGCTPQEEAPQPAPGSLTHSRTDYECSGPPVSWATFDGGHIGAPLDGSQGESGDTWTSPAAWEFFSQF